MDIFTSTKNSGNPPDEWNRKLPPGCHRKLNFYSTNEAQKLPSVNLTTSGRGHQALTWASKSSHHVGSNKMGDPGYFGDYRDKKKNLARRHLIGSLSAPMKNTAVVRSTSIGQGSPPRGYPDVRQTFEIDNLHRKPGGDHLQGIDKIDNIFQKRLDLRVQKAAPYQNMPARMVSTSLENRGNDNDYLRKPLFMQTDVAKLSDVNDMFSEETSDDSVVQDTQKTSSNLQQRRPSRVNPISQYRPLTPNLMKKLNKMKLSALTTTQLWVNQLPTETPVFNRHLGTNGHNCVAPIDNNGNNGRQKVLTRWIYGGDR
ncbi:uncharacterized protein LOC135469091 [Liolophura sinensis]|uniref:uncharacterized protein LOC135469091 n=1 Tax=Liolophura sinensis TaxID=3198878 RepID=UPI0031595CAF